MKRFTETMKWYDPWFFKLTTPAKLLWMYICDLCDASGVIDFCPEIASVQIGAEFTDKSLEDFGHRIRKLPSGKWQIVKFLVFQYGTVDANCPAHKPVIRLIESNGLNTLSNTLSNRVSDTLKDKDKEKEKDKEGDSKGKPKAVSEVAVYGTELGLDRDECSKFFDFYTSNGWKVGRNPMKDWKAALRNWRKNAGMSVQPKSKYEPPSHAPAYPIVRAGPDLTDEQIAKNKKVIAEEMAKLKELFKA